MFMPWVAVKFFLVAMHFQMLLHQALQNALYGEHFHLSMIFMLCFHCICFKISQNIQCWKLPTRQASYSLHIQAYVMFLIQTDAEVSLTALQSHKHSSLCLCSSASHTTLQSPKLTHISKQKSQNGPLDTDTTCSCSFGAGRVKFQQLALFCIPLLGPAGQWSPKALSMADWIHKRSSRGPIWFDLTSTD